MSHRPEQLNGRVQLLFLKTETSRTVQTGDRCPIFPSSVLGGAERPEAIAGLKARDRFSGEPISPNGIANILEGTGHEKHGQGIHRILVVRERSHHLFEYVAGFNAVSGRQFSLSAP
jgi:hypothetical protein